jgi:hypothetical protein
MSLDDNVTDPAPASETALSPFLLDVDPAIHLQADRVGLHQTAEGLLVAAWVGNRKVAEHRISPDLTTCQDGKLTIRMPGDWRYGFGSPGHASFSLELTLARNGELVMRSLYRSWTVVFLTIPVMGNSDREMRFSSLDMPLNIASPRTGLAAGPTDCNTLAGRYMTVGDYLKIPNNRNHTELKSVTIQDILPFAASDRAPKEEVSARNLQVEVNLTDGLTFSIHNPGDTPLVSSVEASKIRCRNGILEFGLHGSLDPAATFWLAGIAYGRMQVRMWRDDFGGLMLEAREITDGTVLVVLPIHHRESTWFRFGRFENEPS